MVRLWLFMFFRVIRDETKMYLTFSDWAAKKETGRELDNIFSQIPVSTCITKVNKPFFLKNVNIQKLTIYLLLKVVFKLCQSI